MTYAVIAILVFMLIAALSVLGYPRSESNPHMCRLAAISDASLGIIGAVLVIAMHVFISIRISSVSEDAVSGSVSFVSWASNMLSGWYSVSLPAAGILLGINVFAALFSRFDKKQQERNSVFLRTAVLTVSSAVPLILAPFYGFMTKNDTVPLYTAILVSGIGMALLFRAVSLIERFPKR